MSAYGGTEAGRAAGGDSRPEMLAAVRTRLIAMGVPPTPAQVAGALRAEGGPLGDDELLAEAKRLGADLTGAGPLQPLLELPGVTDVLVNGPDEVWVDGGRGLARVTMTLGGEAAVRGLAQRLAAAAGRRLDDACPYVDARLPDGTRLHAVLPPVAPDGTHLSLRLPRRRAFGLDELVAAGGVPPLGARLLRGLVAARVAFLVTGGTGTGKTTWLAALLSLADPAERVVLVEDSAELWPDHAHTVRLQTRTSNVEGAGGVPMHELVRQALRMRPDRLVVGEVRGAEVVDLLAALNTGHEGGCGTLHANAAADVPARLEALGCAAGLSREAVHSQLASALSAVIHLVRDRPDGRRRVAEICVLQRDATGLVSAVPGITFPTATATPAGTGVATGAGTAAATATGTVGPAAFGVGYPALRALLGEHAEAAG